MVAARSVAGWPCSASSTYWKPPVLPRPMIGGRLKGKTTAPSIAASCGRSLAMMASTFCAGSRRWSNGFRRMTKNAWFEEAMPSMKSKPMTESMPSTPGIGVTMRSTCSATACVRFTEAPCGRVMAAKNAPWSSSGRKLFGVMLNTPAEAAMTPITTTTPTTATRTSRRTIAA